MTGPAAPAERDQPATELQQLYTSLQPRLLNARFDEESQGRFGWLRTPPGIERRVRLDDHYTAMSHLDFTVAFGQAYDTWARQTYGNDYRRPAYSGHLLPGLDEVPREVFDPEAVTAEILRNGTSILSVDFYEPGERFAVVQAMLLRPCDVDPADSLLGRYVWASLDQGPAHIDPNQPVIIDFAKMLNGQGGISDSFDDWPLMQQLAEQSSTD